MLSLWQLSSFLTGYQKSFGIILRDDTMETIIILWDNTGDTIILG